MATFDCVAQKVASAAQLLLMLASLHAVACFNVFAIIPAFDGVHTVLVVLLLLSFLLLLLFLLLLAFLLLTVFLLLLASFL